MDFNFEKKIINTELKLQSSFYEFGLGVFSPNCVPYIWSYLMNKVIIQLYPLFWSNHTTSYLPSAIATWPKRSRPCRWPLIETAVGEWTHSRVSPGVTSHPVRLLTMCLISLNPKPKTEENFPTPTSSG